MARAKAAAPGAETRAVFGRVNYTAPMTERPRYHANDASRDVLVLDPRSIEVRDARGAAAPPSLEREGFALFRHASAVANFRDAAEVRAMHAPEIERLVAELSGADRVVVSSPGVLRFGERSAESGRRSNSRPARFVHVDVSAPTAAAFAERSRPRDDERPLRRFAHYNVWRVLTPPPQDVPLAVCDAGSVAPEDLVPADAVFDEPGRPEWSFEGLVVRFNPAHRWFYYSGMAPDEALVFKTYDSDPGAPRQVPHSAFDDSTCPTGVPPRTSIEMRAIAYWLA
ncbi:MAG TPA: CmcJ/NvfI family oxidoreductase [Gammaproteobacteria bacterium]|nr:CmcJ/NvfI family oxidoreductase [Gammaproteobacteria bacterium]